MQLSVLLVPLQRLIVEDGVELLANLGFASFLHSSSLFLSLSLYLISDSLQEGRMRPEHLHLHLRGQGLHLKGNAV